MQSIICLYVNFVRSLTFISLDYSNQCQKYASKGMSRLVMELPALSSFSFSVAQIVVSRLVANLFF